MRIKGGNMKAVAQYQANQLIMHKEAEMNLLSVIEKSSTRPSVFLSSVKKPIPF